MGYALLNIKTISIDFHPAFLSLYQTYSFIQTYLQNKGLLQEKNQQSFIL